MYRIGRIFVPILYIFLLDLQEGLDPLQPTNTMLTAIENCLRIAPLLIGAEHAIFGDFTKHLTPCTGGSDGNSIGGYLKLHPAFCICF